MAGLSIRLSEGDRLVINGAAIQVESDTRLRITNKVNILFGDQIMSPEDANTPARRIYFAIQNFHVSNPEEREKALEGARYFIDAFRSETTSHHAKALLDIALEEMKAANGYAALRVAQRIIRHEAAVLGGTEDKAEKTA